MGGAAAPESPGSAADSPSPTPRVVALLGRTPAAAGRDAPQPPGGRSCARGCVAAGVGAAETPTTLREPPRRPLPSARALLSPRRLPSCRGAAPPRSSSPDPPCHEGDAHPLRPPAQPCRSGRVSSAPARPRFPRRRPALRHPAAAMHTAARVREPAAAVRLADF